MKAIRANTNKHIALILFLVFSIMAGGSTWRGQTANLVWTNPVDITGGVSVNTNQYDTLACDPYQNVHLFWADQSEYGAAIFYRNNAGGDWSFPSDILAVRDTNVNYLRSAISTDPDMVHLSWVNLTFNGVMYYSNASLSKAGEPSEWLPPYVIATGVSNSDIDVDPSGNIHLVYSSSDEVGINNDVYHMISSDSGTTWTEPELIFSRTFAQPSFIQVWEDIDGKGRVHVGLTMRSQEYGLTSEVGYMRTIDDGGSWDEYKLLDNKGTAWQGVAWIEPFAFGDDEIHLTWHDPRRMHSWSMDGGKTWSQPEEIMALGAAFGGPNELTKDSLGTVHVVTAVADGVYSAEWKNQRWSTPEQIDTRHIDPHGQHITTCGGNKLHVTYYDRVGDETVWYSTRELRAPSIESKPIPQPTADPQAQQVGASAGAAAVEATPTVNTLRETLAASQTAPPVTTRFTLSRLLAGVIPSLLLIFGIIFFIVAKLRR
jgi:hypothetical protein